MPSTSITWNAILDQKTCLICRDLHNYQWIFTAKEGIPDQLVHPKHGIVWTKQVGSRAHGHQNFNCRCTITPHIDVSDLTPRIEQLKQDVEKKLNE